MARHKPQDASRGGTPTLVVFFVFVVFLFILFGHVAVFVKLFVVLLGEVVFFFIFVEVIGDGV